MEGARPEARQVAVTEAKTTTVEELTTAQKVTRAWQWAVASGKHSYAGTVPAAVVAKRRAKNRVAKQSRKVNRGK